MMETPLATTQAHGEATGQTHSQISDPFDFVESNDTECQNLPKRLPPRLSMESIETATVAPGEPGRNDDSNNNTKQKSRHAVVTSLHSTNCSDASGDDTSLSPSDDVTMTNTYTCQSCELTVASAKTYLHHLVERHGEVFNIYECDLCEYATRCQDNLPRHRKGHFGTDASPRTEIADLQGTSPENEKIAEACEVKDQEGCDAHDKMSFSEQQKNVMSSQDGGEQSVKSPGQNADIQVSNETKDKQMKAVDTELMMLHKTDITMASADCKTPEANNETYWTQPADGCVPQSASSDNYFQAAGSAAVEDKELGPISDVVDGVQHFTTKLMCAGSPPGTNSGGKRRTYTPVREAVDPGKYMIIHEIDGTKYACSKCGNIYKWRKSLNKHWKEKHGGQTPDMPIVATHYGIPSATKKEKKHASASPMHFSPLSSSNGNLKKLPASSQNSLKQMESQWQHFGTSNFQMSRKMLSSSASKKRPVSLVDEYASGYIKRACSYNSKSRVTSPAFPADMKAMSAGYNFYSDVYPSVVTPKPLYVNHHNCDSVMKLSPTPSLPTPPTAHAHYMTSGVMSMVADIPVDLSSSQCSSVYSDNSEENVLDLSKDSAFTSLKTPSLHVPVPQAEPLDFSVRPHKPVESAAPKQCSVCAYVSKSTVDYAEHMAVHNTKTDHRCATCEQPFHNINDLNDHFQQCHLDVLNTDMCGLDNNDEPLSYRTTEKAQLLKYLTKKEAQPKLPFCVVCGVKFEGQKSLAAHFAQLHPSLASHGYLSQHPHTPVGVKLEIDTCSGSKQEQHRQPFDIEENQPALLQCSLCVFQARTTSELAVHQLKHSLNISLCCKICGCSCQSKHELLLHYNTHHGHVSVPGSQDLKLDVSGGSLEAYHSDDSENGVPMDNLTQIMVGDTVIDLTADGTMVVIPQAPEETTSPLSTKTPFGGRPSKKCATGVNALTPGGSSASAEMLLPYKCSVCEYRARWPSEITQHMKNHSDEKPYSCPHCTYKSKWKWDVVKHLKRCGGGGTVKDVIDNTRRKKQLQPLTLTMLPDDDLPKLSPEDVGPTNREVLSGGPPNVTVQQKGDILATAAVSPMQYAQQEFPLQINPEDLALSPSEKTRHVQSQLYCQKCPFIGNSPAELKRHSRVHSEEKPFICKTCGYCSKWKCDLKKHLRAYNHTPAVPLVYGGHGRKPVEWYSNMLMNNRPMSDTETSFGNEEPIDASSAFLSAVYRCSRCPYITGKMQLLEHHMKTHTGMVARKPKTLKCKKCDFEADDLPGFVQHKLTHSTKHTDKQSGAWPGDGHGKKLSKMPIISIHRMNGLISNDHCAPNDDSSASDDCHAAEDGYSSETDCEDTAENYRQFVLPPEKYPSTPQPASVKYRCVHCPYKTFDRGDFEKHIPVHVASGFYKCQWCSWTTNRLNMLYQHAQLAHSLELEEEDKEETRSEETFETQAKCEAQDLQQTHDSRAEELGHLNDEPEGEKEENDAEKTCNYVAKHGCSGKYQCNFCDYSVDKHHVLLYHLRIVHDRVQGNISTEQSDECRTKLAVDDAEDTRKQAKTGDWEAHKTVLPEGISVCQMAGKMCYACTKCTHVTGDVSNALNHAKPHGAQKLYTCEYCDYSLDQLRRTIHHMQTFHVQAVDRSQTSKDYRKQKDRAQLKLQQLAGFQCVTIRVNGRVQYRCLTCAAASRSKQRTLTHIISQHVKSRRYMCRKCGYKATTASLRRKHSLKRHPKANPAMQADSTPCNNFNKDKAMMQHCMICPFYSNSTAELMIHNDHHGMALPFQCDLCSYSHQQLNQIYQHRKLHKDDSSFKTSVPAKLLINTSHFAGGDSVESMANESSSSSGTDDATPTGIDLTCSRCTYTSSSLKTYQVHKDSHGADKKYRCDYCDWSVDAVSLLRSHRSRVHISEPDFDPNRSSRELATNEGEGEEDDSTLALKTDGKQHNCHFCPHISVNIEASHLHEACHKVKSRHSCGTCSFSVDELPLLQRHQKLHEHIASSHKHVECPRCPFRTHSHTLLAMHARMHGAVNKYLCEFCDYSVSRFNLMGQHMRVHGVKPVKQNNNVHSTTKTPRKRYTYNNKRMVCGSDTELLTCDRCPYQACSLTSMAQHSLGHSTRARHSCPYCDFTSMKMIQLTAHVNLHFPGTSLDLQKSSQLVKINGYPSNDDNHAMDLIERPIVNGSDCTCHFCDRTFSDSTDLQQHEQMHMIGGGTC